MESPEKPTLLIVDDNPTNIKVLFEFMKESGFRVLVAKDGESTLIKLESVMPDLILLDVMMPPGIDGFETCTRIKENPKNQDLPIIFMTVLADTKSKVKGLALGAARRSPSQNKPTFENAKSPARTSRKERATQSSKYFTGTKSSRTHRRTTKN
jgi:CheY-like chemotaxis protein